MKFEFDARENGEYKAVLTLEAKSDTTVSVFGNHRRFIVFEEPMKKGEVTERKFAFCIKDADFQKKENYRDEKFEITVEGNVDTDVKMRKCHLPTIYTLGDSTVCDQTCASEGAMFRCGGWGQALGLFAKDAAAVSNHAEQGTTTADCLACHIVPILKSARRGDTVLCQFGHNDQKNARLDAFGGYLKNLIEMGERVKKTGAEFVICTPINRLIYTDGKINTYLDPWRDAAKRASEILKVRCVDLHTFTTNLYEREGSAAERLFYHAPELDRTHPNDLGAIKIAEYVYARLKS